MSFPNLQTKTRTLCRKESPAPARSAPAALETRNVQLSRAVAAQCECKAVVPSSLAGTPCGPLRRSLSRR